MFDACIVGPWFLVSFAGFILIDWKCNRIARCLERIEAELRATRSDRRRNDG